MRLSSIGKRSFLGLMAGAAVLTMAACSGNTTGSQSAATTSQSPRPTPSPTPTQAVKYYVSLGDSYAAGWQATGHGSGHTTTNGFAYQLASEAAGKGYHLTLQNFGCAGATTRSIFFFSSFPRA